MVSLITAFRDLVRLQEINRVLVRHGFGQLVTRLRSGNEKAFEASAEDARAGEAEAKRVSTAERIRLVAQDLGPSFVKLGQIVSTRTDLPADITAELKKLQDAVQPVSIEEVKAQIEACLGKPVSEVYASFDERPLAAASIGQVHRAKLKTPEGDVDVVVKVQRPGVGPTVARDLDLLHTLARVIERTIPESATYSPSAMVDNFDRSITAELDYTLEAENAARFAKHFEGRTDVRFPRVYKDASGKTVLTQEFLPGLKVEQALAQGYSPRSVTQLVVNAVVKMIFEDGFFHADPHPGNMLILGPPDAPVIGLLDLGNLGGVAFAGGLLLVFLASMGFAALLNVTIDRLVYKPLRNAPKLAPLVSAIGVSFILQNVIQYFVGPYTYNVPQLFPVDWAILVGETRVPFLNIFVIVVAVALMIVLQLFISRTRTGKAMRTTAMDRDASALMGVDIDRTIMITFLIGSGLAGAAGTSTPCR